MRRNGADFPKAVDSTGKECYNMVDYSNTIRFLWHDREAKVEFSSILDMEESPYKKKRRPAFYQDLNLDQVIERIRLDWGEEVSSFYYWFPANSDCEDYRREVFSDVKTGYFYDILCRFSGKMKQRREACAWKGEVKENLQKAVWHLREVGCYCEAFGELWEAMKELPLKSRGMQAFREYLSRYLTGAFYVEMQSRAAELLIDMKDFRLVLTYENDRIAIAQGEVEGSYDDFLENLFPGHGRLLVSPFTADVNLVELEEGLMKAFRKRNPDFFRGVEEFYGEYGNYADECLIRFASEIGFYLSFYRFQGKMRERGYAFCEPVMRGRTVPVQARGLYDLALACAGREVITNDAILYPEERFFILTGPNQGGKTTFARSLGQLVYFAKMGLDVPATSAEVYRFTDILTHFSVEESVETGRGKLQEELERLADIMAASQEDGAFAFVVINELFTTAANYDAGIMGKRVLEYFLAKGSRGIYVTHLSELEGEDPRLVSLRAMLDENGRRTFRIDRSREDAPADAGSLVGKHGLTYEQLKERLA